jgi:DNA-binding XRE family transcriptional regulator
MIRQVLKITSMNMATLADMLNISRQTIYSAFNENLERNHTIRSGPPKIITS